MAQERAQFAAEKSHQDVTSVLMGAPAGETDIGVTDGSIAHGEAVPIAECTTAEVALDDDAPVVDNIAPPADTIIVANNPDPA